MDIETGDVVGEHDGVHCWTIGQRLRFGRQGPQLGGHHHERGYKTNYIWLKWKMFVLF